MADATIDDVEDHFANHDNLPLDPTQKKHLVDKANRLGNTVFGGRIARNAQVEGSEVDFKSLLGAHLWELAMGGEAQSDSQTGGSVTYNVMSGDVEESLTETRHGRMAKLYLRNNASISVEKT